MKRALIIDGNNRAWAAYHAYSSLSWKGDSVAMIYGLPSMIKALLSEFTPDIALVVWDGQRSKHRIKHCPDYKGKRKEKALVDYEDFDRQKKVVMNLLYFLGVRQILNPEQEADDMIYKACLVLEKKGYDDIIIVSGDKDFHQLIKPKMLGWAGRRVYSESRKKLIDYNNCKEEFGYEPLRCVDYLILTGDDTDNIKGYGGIGEVRAKEFFSKFRSLVDFLECDEEFRFLDKKKLLEVIQRNRILIDLKEYYKNYKDELKIIFYRHESKPKVNREKFLALTASYNMRKLMSKNFINSFKSLHK